MSKQIIHFTREEASCKCGCGFDAMDMDLVNSLENVRKWFKKPVVISSWCRCVSHNEKQPGHSKTSQHLLGKAVDFFVVDVHEDEVVKYLEMKYSNSCGIGRYDGRTHFDIRNQKARWDKRGE